ncbi:hypothetical protein [Streptomyces sp. NPDC058953]|uniref:hypothetical protein n=1 Tax=unclassified Streptomyces TaxID=2593676 RepID=UPI00367683C0
MRKPMNPAVIRSALSLAGSPEPTRIAPTAPNTPTTPSTPITDATAAADAPRRRPATAPARLALPRHGRDHVHRRTNAPRFVRR